MRLRKNSVNFISNGPILLVWVAHGKSELEGLIQKVFTVKPRANVHWHHCTLVNWHHCTSVHWHNCTCIHWHYLYICTLTLFVHMYTDTTLHLYTDTICTYVHWHHCTSLATTIQYQRYGIVCEGNPTFESCVERKSSGREIPCTLGVPELRTQHWASSDQLCLHKGGKVMGVLKAAPAARFNFPLKSFYLYTTFKSWIAVAGQPILSE